MNFFCSHCNVTLPIFWMNYLLFNCTVFILLDIAMLVILINLSLLSFQPVMELCQFLLGSGFAVDVKLRSLL